MKGVAMIAGLTLIYALTAGSLAWPDLFAAAVVSTALYLFFPAGHAEPPVPTPPLWKRVPAFVPFAAAVFWDVAQGTWKVTLVVLGLGEHFQSGIVAIPIGDRSDLGITVTGLTMTLSPGSYLLDVDREAGQMYFHFVDANDPDDLRRTCDRLYTRYQRLVFP